MEGLAVGGGGGGVVRSGECSGWSFGCGAAPRVSGADRDWGSFSRWLRFLCSLLSLVVLLACTAVRIREHTRESYLAPPGRRVAESRLIQGQRDRVFQLAREELRRRGFALVEASVEAGRIVGRRRLRAGDESSRFALLGTIEKTVTQTTRRYRSYNPRHLRCEPCIVREGRLISSETALVERSLHPIDVDLDARVVVTLRARAESSELRVELELSPVERLDPLGPLEPRSSGAFEFSFLEAVAALSS